MESIFYKGIIENNLDPQNLQRVQVRIMGIHNFNEAELPSVVLPWAEPALPISGYVDGGYGDFKVPNIGDWVWLFFHETEKSSIMQKRKPYYFAIIRTPKDSHPDYKQTINEIHKDKFDNQTLTDSSHTEWNNGKETVKFDINEDGNIKLYSSNANKAIIDIGGDGTRSSAVNYTNLDKWMTKVETLLATHVHIGNLGYPTSSTSDVINLNTLIAELKLLHPTVESKKLQISTYEDSQ
jgi:hypothetical protein